MTAVGANIVIPLQPVPITLQTLFVLLGGAILGFGWGSLAQVFYVSMGVAGIPVFAGITSGASIAVGPTGGYLIGFVIAPLVVRSLIGRRESFWWQVLVFYLGSLTILSLGVTYLALFYTKDLGQALQVGYLPFIPGDILKILAAASIYRSYSALRRSRTQR